MKKYKYVSFFYLLNPDLDETLNRLGAMGYRVIHIDSDNQHVVMEKEEKPNE